MNHSLIEDASNFKGQRRDLLIMTLILLASLVKMKDSPRIFTEECFRLLIRMQIKLFQG